jgi:hypothetical protein
VWQVGAQQPQDGRERMLLCVGEGALADDGLQKSVHEQAVADAADKGVVNQRADCIDGGDWVDGRPAKRLWQQLRVTGEQVERDRLRRQPGAEFEELDCGRMVRAQPLKRY